MKRKIAIGILISVISLLGLGLVIYLKVLPFAVANQNVIDFVQDKLKENLGIEAVIKEPVLKTHLSSDIEFSIEQFDLTGENGQMVAVNNFDAKISMKEILNKNVILKKLGADFIFVDTNKLSEISIKKDKKEKTKSDWNVDVFDTIFYVKNVLVLHKIDNTFIKLTAKDLEVDNTQKIQRFLHFDLKAEIKKAEKELHFDIKDNNAVYFKDNHLWVKKCFLNVNNSKIFFDANADKKKNYDINVYSDKILVDDVLTLIDSQIIENNLQEPLSYFKDLKGSFNFNIKLTNDNLGGIVNLNRIDTKIVPVENIPLTLTQGKISLTKDKITLSDFKGYYANNPKNDVTLEGTVDDYLKSIDTKLISRAAVTNDFMKNYLSKMVGMPVELTGGTTRTRLDLKAINNKIDMIWYFVLKSKQDILLDGSSYSPVEFTRGIKSDMHFENNLLSIKSLDYYIVPDRLLTKENVPKLRPILNLYGDIDIANNSNIKRLGFKIPQPMPSEFLNLLIGQRIFKNGKVSGSLAYENSGKYPIIDGKMIMDMVAIPSQRLFVKHGELSTGNGLLSVNAEGGYRRSKYNLTGDFINEVKFPIVAKDIKLTVDNIDIEKFLASANKQNSQAIQSEQFDLTPSGTAKDDDDNNPTFDIGNFVVENCLLKVLKGSYKDITFNGVEANLKLDKNSILDINSNKFEIANGYSSAKINCNLKKHKYNMLLGIEEIDSDLIASILQLEKEISGKASGTIDLNTDDSMRLNGTIKFLVKDGTIQKIGLVEYILKMAALFRNPLTMISPSVFADLVNVPEGKFDTIDGHLVLKDNVIERLMIKSTSPQLSSFIVGRYDLENSDASLRIYTKFSNKNKGVFGLLRNISLNSLANRIPLTAKNDSNHYAAELSLLPPINADEKDCQVFLTKVDGDVEHNNFISSLKKIK